MPVALKFATTEQPVSNEQCLVQLSRLLNTELLQLSGNGGAHSFNRTGRAHRLTITLLAKANQFARGMPLSRRITDSKTRDANPTSAAFLFGTFQPLHQYFLDRSPQASQTSQPIVCGNYRISDQVLKANYPVAGELAYGYNPVRSW